MSLCYSRWYFVLVIGLQAVNHECWAYIGKGFPFLIGSSFYLCDVEISSPALIRSVMSTELERAAVPS